MINIVKIESHKELKKFIDFPHDLYRGDSSYVPELYISQKAMFNENKYPFFEHSKVAFYLAYISENIVGRIAAIKNNNHIRYSGEKCGFFGFFESVEDYDVTKALIETAINWLKNEGLTAIAGPENFTTNDSCGFLIEGFEKPPVVMMPYNKTYYAKYFERFGFRKKIDLLSYFISSNETPERIAPVMKRVEERLNGNGIKIRTINFKNSNSEIVRFREVYNAAYENNWGFVPLTDNEFDYQARELKKIADPNMMLFAEKDENPIGFVCAIPDINQVLIKIKRGRLFPSGIFKLLFNKSKINQIRILIIGVLPEYRQMGIDSVMFSKIFDYSRGKSIQTAEAAYVMEDNVQMNRILMNIGAEKCKKYRIYEYSF